MTTHYSRRELQEMTPARLDALVEGFRQQRDASAARSNNDWEKLNQQMGLAEDVQDARAEDARHRNSVRTGSLNWEADRARAVAAARSCSRHSKRLSSCPDCAEVARQEKVRGVCYACGATVPPDALCCPSCGNTVRCAEPGCTADMSEAKCFNDKTQCVDHCCTPGACC